MNTRMKIAALGIAALAAVGLSACGGPSAEETPTESAYSVTVLTPYLANAATKEAIDDLVAEGESRGWTVSVVDTAGDLNKLNSAFQDAAAEAPDAIVMASGDPTQVSLGLSAAKAANVPVFAFDAAVADGILANVTSDNSDLGKQSAEKLVELLGGSGSVVMLTYSPHPGVNARAVAASKVFEDAGIEVIEKKEVQVPGPVDDARASIQDLISARGDDIDGIWAGWDEPALGATQALEAAGVTDVSVTGVDGQDFAIEAIQSGGPFKATVKQDWKAITLKVADLIQAFLDDGTEPDQDQYELPGTLITE